MEDILKKAKWLSRKQKSVIRNAIEHNHLAQKLTDKERKKLTKVLCSIIYAEQKQDEHGKFRTRIIEKVIELTGLATKLDTSLGSWQLNVKHHEKFELAKDDFKEIMMKRELTMLLI